MNQTIYVTWQEAEGWVSKCLVTGVTSCGDSQTEAVEMLKEALALYFEEETDVSTPQNISFGNLELNA